MNLATIRARLATLAETVTDYDPNHPLRAFPVMPRGNLEPPIFYLLVESGPDPNRTNGGATADGGLKRVVLTGRLLVDTVESRDLEGAQAELDFYRDPASIWAAVMADNTLSGAAAGVLARAWAGLESVEINDESYVGDELEIWVDAI